MKIIMHTLLFTVIFLQATVGFAKDYKHSHRPDQVLTPVGMNEIVYVDHSLNKEFSRKTWLSKSRLKVINISLEKSVIRTNQAGYKQVISVFRNHTDFDYVLEARTHFFDEDELPVDTVTKWKRIFIPANSIQTYQTMSVNQTTAYFRTEVRSAK